MLNSLTTFFTTFSSIFRSRAILQLENLALRHQIGVRLCKIPRRTRVNPYAASSPTLQFAPSDAWGGYLANSPS